MTSMKLISRLLVPPLLAASLAACDSSPLLRDNYMGQNLLEPELLPRPVARDNKGNPILHAQSRDREGFWQSFKVW